MKMDQKFNIRPALREDLVSIVAMLADDPLGKTRESCTLPLAPSYYRAFDLIRQDPMHELMVLLDQEVIIGTFQLSFLPYITYQGGLRAQIEGVRAHKDRRGEGLGEMILKWAIERSRDKGAHVLQLTTDKKRPEAKVFYEKLGFQASHEGMKLDLS